MALRVPWDEYETALLIDTCLQIDSGAITRKSAVTDLSRRLRQRAIKNGLEIDEIYRNENGISMQIGNVQRLLHHIPDAEKHNTKMFIDMVSIYNKDKKRFDAILSVAKGGELPVKTNQELFVEWLSENVSPARLSDYYMVFAEIEAYAKKKKIARGPFFEETNSATTLKLLNSINSDRIFRFMHKKQMRSITDVSQLFHRYTKENEAKRIEDSKSSTPFASPPPKLETEPEPIHGSEQRQEPVLIEPVQSVKSDTEDGNNQFVPQTSSISYENDEKGAILSDVLLVDFERDNNYAFTKPISASYFGEEAIESSWRKLYVRICIFLIEDYPSVFSDLRDGSVSGDRKYLVFNTETAKRLTTPAEIREGYYVETNRSASDLIHNIKGLLDACRVDYENLVIRYTKSDEKAIHSILPSQIEESRQTDAFEEPDKNGLDTHAPQRPEVTIDVRVDRNAFQLWLQGQGLASGSVRTSLWAFSKVDEYAVKYQLVKESLYYVTNDSELIRLWGQLCKIKDFSEYYKTNKIMSFAFNKYRAYRRGEGLAATSSTQIVGNQAPPSKEDSVGDRRQGFIQWMEARGLSRSTCAGYASSIASIDDYASRHGLINKSFYEMDDNDELETNWRKLLASQGFVSYNNEQHNRFSAAIRRYLEFRKAGPQTKPQTAPKQQVSSGPIIAQSCLRVHPGRTEFEEWLRTANSPAGSIKTYADSVERIGRFLLDRGLEDRNIFSIRGVARLETIRTNILSNEEYTQGGTSANLSLDLYGLRKYINFRKNDSSGDFNEKEVERFSTILRDKFENGFRINSMIDRNRFKQYYADQYGKAPEMGDEEILHFLRQIGTIQEDRVFMRDGSSHYDLLDDIQAEIASAFKRGASCVYYSELYGRYHEKLAEQVQVFSQDVLKQLLVSTSYGEYRASKHYFYLNGRTPNAEDDIRKLMQPSATPLDYEGIHQRLWYIPLDTIKHCLVTTAEMVNVAQEAYFYAPNLPVSAEELNRIAELIHDQLSQKSFVTDLEMRTLIEKNCPSVAINTESYTTWGLRNCLSVLLRDRFAFVGPIISEKGQALNMSQVFAEFSKSHEQMTFDELKAFAKEINNGFIYWDSVLEVMVRISQDEFVPKDKIDFDIEAIDGVLDELMDGDYAPLKTFRLFLHFPAISVRWNEFVLESYVAGYSKKFSLMHASYTATECCGGIVRKESEIKDFQGLITNVLAHSDSWQTKSDALSLLVNKGYLQRKHYTKIDVILPEAKLLREKYKSEG